ncbi:MAG: McrC family protein [Formosimonas sp.]
MPITVCEYAQLTTADIQSNFERAQISDTAFDFLCGFMAKHKKSGASLLHLEDRVSLRLDSYVGIIETPCGTVLEILPKHVKKTTGAKEEARKLLYQMLTAVLNLPKSRDSTVSHIALAKIPLHEWIMAQFLAALDELIKHGVRHDYQNIESEERFLRGQLNLPQQLRQPIGRQHFFQIRHDIYSANRPENRLLQSALHKIARHTRLHQRLTQELLHRFAGIPQSINHPKDFGQWQNSRLMAHYSSIKPWCELILGERMPWAVRGLTQGMSFLIPMEKLFERYVEVCLRKQLPAGWRLKAQKESKYLCVHNGENMFRLRPDFVLTHGATEYILDAKWKLLDAGENSETSKYGISQGDFYQMFAYGHKYLHRGAGEMFLIYPKTDDFQHALPKFEFSEQLSLTLLPFDLSEARLCELYPLEALMPQQNLM